MPMNFTLTISGVTFEGRQETIQWAKETGLKSVAMVREKSNPADPNAIAIYVETPVDRKKLGYIPNRGKCLWCDKEQKGHGIPSYKIPKKDGKIDPNFECPSCGKKGTMDPGTADKIAHYMDEGIYCKANIIGYVGGEEGKPTNGVVLNIYVETI
jgi:hypothetical protein